MFFTYLKLVSVTYTVSPRFKNFRSTFLHLLSLKLSWARFNVPPNTL